MELNPFSSHKQTLIPSFYLLPTSVPRHPLHRRPHSPSPSPPTVTLSSPHSTDLHQTLRSYSSTLQSFTATGSLIHGKTLHARLLRRGIQPDTHLYDTLINLYSKCGCIYHARYLFDEMPQRDVVAWTAMITGYSSVNDAREGVRLFGEMKREGIETIVFALSAGIRASALCSDLESGLQMHAEAIKSSAPSDMFVGSSLVDLYVKCGEIGLAENVFSGLPEWNEVSWNVLLNGYARTGHEKKVVELFGQLAKSEVSLSKFTLSIVLKCCAGLGDLRQGRAVHSLVSKIGLGLDEFLSSVLVDMYSNCGLAEDAWRVFAGIKEPDVVDWSTMLSCFGRQGFVLEAVELFRTMLRKGVEPNQFTLASVASVASELGDQRCCISVHAYIMKSGYAMENTVGNAVLQMYMNMGSVRDGCLVFDSMVDRDTISWNALLSGFHTGSECLDGIRLFSEMLSKDYKPNKYTFTSVLRSCSSLTEASYVVQVHVHILKNNLHSDPFVGTALLVIITGYTKNDQGEKAIKCYRQMQREGVCPNEFTLATCLRSCSNLSSLDSGLQFHSWLIKSGYSDAFTSSALVDMYLKCGCLQDAESIFDSSTAKDVVSWNTIICGYSQHGYGEKALETFQCMLDAGEKPDGVTFIGVLSACSHAGLVDEGRRHFSSLSHIYGITPTIEHHACMIDILGRAGRLDEVQHFIDEMTPSPNALIWRTVLAACRMHRNISLGERAANNLIELEPEVDSTYVLLSNIYAASKMWADVARVRAMMSSLGVKKEPGCSWIEVNGQVHVFLSKDGSHSMTEEIYLKLNELTEEITLTGYVINTEYVLNDVAETKLSLPQ